MSRRDRRRRKNRPRTRSGRRKQKYLSAFLSDVGGRFVSAEAVRQEGSLEIFAEKGKQKLRIFIPEDGLRDTKKLISELIGALSRDYPGQWKVVVM